MMKLILTTILFLFSFQVFSQTVAQEKKLKELSAFLQIEEKRNYEKALRLAIQKGWPLQQALPNGGIMKLVGVYPNGFPEYIATESNVGAANTIGTSSLWNGGVSNLNLSGSNAALAGKLGIWDGGALLSSHQELTGRVLGGDGSGSISDHATHVAGTMIARGVNASARGMAYNVANITSFDFTSDNSEMASNAANFLVSNHSYGTISGWRFNNNTWEFNGEWDASEDYQFGYYDTKSRYWDSISVLAPNYLIVKSAGNKRNENGPQIGQNYSRRNQSGVMTPQGLYPGGISPNNSYDIIPTAGCAKNVLTVGAVSILNDGYSGSSSVAISDFSSYGPTDDGRIKPDIVAAGVDLFSPIGTGNAAYDTYSGTSMSSPNASASLFLLQELYNRETGSFMRSATLKGIAIHSASEAGIAPGPDYIYGWGLLDVLKGSKVITGRNNTHRILQNNLAQAATFSQNFIASGTESLTATLVWTDPHAQVTTVNYLNNRTAKLINDLDLRIVSSSGTELPWRLDVNNPAADATRGDNIIDNVEKIQVANTIPGQTYEVRVTHKGALVNGSQNYSLILSGVGGTAYCASQPNSSNNSRIDNFTFAGINRNGSGCTQYTNATSIFATTYPSQSAAFTLTLGTCGANIDKMAKIFIDWNGDGDFVDANELVATSGVINATGAFTGNIITPSSVVIGASTRIRIVCSETTDANTIQPCGTYAFGETLDFSIKFSQAITDATPVSVFLPESGICANSNTMVAATIKNNGTGILNTIPVRAQILDGATTVATLLDTLKTILQTGNIGTVYFRNTFVSQAGKAYTIKLNTNFGGEQVRSNDTLTVLKEIAGASSATVTNAAGQLCTASQASVTSTIASGNTVYWYTSLTGGSPIGNGNNALLSPVPANNTFYAGVNDAKANVGAPSKAALGTSGGYVAFSNVTNITTHTPVLLESARMYFGNSGTVNVTLREASSGNIVEQTTLYVLPTTSTPGSAANDVSDTGKIMPLNFKITNPGNYTLGISASGGATVFRNNSITANPYPYTANSLMDVTGNNFANPGQVYYWFYDMRVSALRCASANARVAVVADPPLSPTISQNGAVLTSSATGTNYQWLKDGGSVSNSNSQSITITASGNYQVIITKGGCTFTSPGFNAVFTNIQNINPAELGLSVTPNPAIDNAVVKLITPKRELVTMDILQLDGKKISTSQFVTLPNTQSSQLINVKGLANGTYILRLYFDGKQVMKKLVVGK